MDWDRMTVFRLGDEEGSSLDVLRLKHIFESTRHCK